MIPAWGSEPEPVSLESPGCLGSAGCCPGLVLWLPAALECRVSVGTSGSPYTACVPPEPCPDRGTSSDKELAEAAALGLRPATTLAPMLPTARTGKPGACPNALSGPAAPYPRVPPIGPNDSPEYPALLCSCRSMPPMGGPRDGARRGDSPASPIVPWSGPTNGDTDPDPDAPPTLRPPKLDRICTTVSTMRLWATLMAPGVPVSAMRRQPPCTSASATWTEHADCCRMALMVCPRLPITRPTSSDGMPTWICE